MKLLVKNALPVAWAARDWLELMLVFDVTKWQWIF
jgi:hypothetical protein